MRESSGPRIVMVGGGSYNWCPRLLSDLMRTPEMEGSHIVLLDPNLQAAEEIAAAGRAIASRLRVKCTIETTCDEASAFTGADFVLITISTGGLDAMAYDLTIPEKYGIYHTVGDTVGPGGWSRALRNIPIFVHLGEQIARYASRATVLNYTNPLSVLTATLIETSGLRTVGLCHGVFSNYRVLERLFGVKESDLCLRFGGVNHFFWVLDFTVRGEPGYPLLAERLAGQSLDDALALGDTDAMGFHSHHALTSELYKEYGYLPYVGDRHTSEFLPGFLTPTVDALDRFKLVRTSIAERRASRARARQTALDLAEGKREPFPRSRETAVDIMMAIAHEKPFIDVVNVPNEGQISNLPQGAVVETLGLIDGLGFRPVTTGTLPETIRQVVEPHCHVQLMTLKAALDGNRDLAMQALMMDPICSHLAPSDVRAMGTELMEATQAWLPQFK